MGLALYRKYRPQAFDEITGQEHIKTTLERQVATEKVAHAYLFSGLRGTGKTSMARILAKAVNCTKRKKDNGEPCTACEYCEMIRDGRALDVLEIDAASHTGVDNVRETIVETAKFAPTRLRYKVFIIDEAHMLSNSAWNALLKIMEEPPAHVIFVLATTEIHKVPATIISRCQRFDFRRVPPSEMVGRLKRISKSEKIEIEEEVLKTVARLSEGCVRDAESILEQLFALGEEKITKETAALVLPKTSMPHALELLEILSARNHREALGLVDRLLEEGIDLDHFSADMLELFRKVLLIKMAGSDTVAALLDLETLKKLEEAANIFSPPQILFSIESLVKAKHALKTTAIPQLPLEVAVVEICGEGDARPDQSGKSAGTLPRTRVGVPETENPASSRRAPARADSQPNLVESNTVSALREGSRQDPRLLPASAQDSRVGLELEEIKNKWSEVLKGAQKENHSLLFLLSTSEPIKIEKGVLQVGVQYPFHRDKLNEIKCRMILEKVLNEVYQAPLRVEGVVHMPVIQESAMSDVLSTLGGRVVE